MTGTASGRLLARPGPTRPGGLDTFDLVLRRVIDIKTHRGIKPGFHYPSSRAELRARELGCIFDTRQLGPSSRVVEIGL